ncbi:MAG: PAS domain S-box protein, partial [Anaerolineae bacterium]
MKIKIFSLLTLTALLLAACGADSTELAVEPDTEEVSPTTVTAEGTLMPRRSAELAFAQGGVVNEVFVQLGERVSAGDVIVQLIGEDSAKAELAATQLEQTLALQALDALYRNALQSSSKTEQALMKAQEAYESEANGWNLGNEDEATDLELSIEDYVIAEENYREAHEKLDEVLDLDEDNHDRLEAQEEHDKEKASLAEAYSDLRTALAENDRSLNEEHINLLTAISNLESARELQERLNSDNLDPEILAAAQARLDAASAHVAAAEAALELYELRAPFNGVLLSSDLTTGETVLPMTPVGVSILDNERKVVFQNSALSHILDMSPERIQTGAYKDRKYLAADGSAMPADGYASMQAQTSGQAVYNVETGVIKENGETIWTSVSALPVNLTTWKTVIVTIDITERKNAEVRMREAELLYRTIFETSLDGLTVFDSKMNITISNKQAAQIYGFDSPAAMVGRNAFEFLPPDEQMRARENARNRRADHVHYDEYRLLRHDGQEFFGETGSLAIPTQEGTPSGLVLGVVRDITERKHLEKKLLVSEERYTILFEKTAVPSILLRLPEVVIVDVNEACEKLTGFSKQEMLGKTAAELGIIKKEQRTEAISQFEKHGSLAEKESRAYTKSGEERIVVANINRVMINEQPFAITTLLDVTGRKQAEIKQQQLTERLDLAARSAHIGIWDWDIQKNEIVWDDQMYALYGLKAGEFGGAYEAWLNGVHPDDREPGNEISAAAVRGEREYDTEFRVLWPDGSVHWLKANGQVYRDKNGTPLRMVGVNYDITERKLAEEKIQESAEFLRLANEATNLGIWKNDLVTGSVEFDERASMHYGFDTQQTTLPELMTHIHPDDVARLGSEIAAVAGPTGDGKFATEYRVIHPDGSVHWLAIGVRVIFEGEGEKRHSVMGFGTSLDITERKLTEQKLRESEERFRIALRNSPIVIFNQDRDLRYTWIYNPAMGFSQEAVLGKTDAELLHVEDAAVLTAIKHHVLITGIPVREEVKSTLNGQTFFYDLSVEPMRDLNGNITGVTCVSVDITERKQA